MIDTLFQRDLPYLLDKRDTCEPDNEYDGSIGVRISAIFVILIAGTFGAVFPILASKYSFVKMPDSVFFVAKYFGSGVIIATALIHLLEPANDSLSEECLGEGWQEYPYAYGICLFVLFVTFFVELASLRYLDSVGLKHSHGPTGLTSSPNHEHSHSHSVNDREQQDQEHNKHILHGDGEGEDNRSVKSDVTNSDSYAEHNLASQIGGILFLEFGIIFHSVFVGLTLAVSGEEFKTLYIVLVFHQLFEGLGLGTRLATAPWPQGWRLLPWFFGLAFGLTTPIAIAIGLGVRESYPPGSSTALITNGIFDAISAGILLYTGLVELIANEFLHSPELKHASVTRVFSAFFVMCWGAGLMALLGRWA